MCSNQIKVKQNKIAFNLRKLDKGDKYRTGVRVFNMGYIGSRKLEYLIQ